MYRDASTEQKERTAARRQELMARAHTALDEHRYGRDARVVVIAGLDRLAAKELAAATAGEVGEVAAALDALEEALSAFTSEAALEAGRAEKYRPLGLPSADAEPYTAAFSRFLFKGGGAWRRTAVVDTLRGAATHWSEQMTAAPLVDPYPERLSLYFEHDGVPLRMNIDIVDFDNGLLTRATLLAAVGRPEASEMSVRPQTMGDDLLASLRIRRDLTFGEETFDTTYFVAGAESDLRARLTPAVRAAFVRVAQDWPATVHVQAGIATMPLARHRSLAGPATLLARLASG